MADIEGEGSNDNKKKRGAGGGGGGESYQTFWYIVLILLGSAILLHLAWYMYKNHYVPRVHHDDKKTPAAAALPKISGLYFDVSRSSVMQIVQDPTDRKRFTITNKTVNELAHGSFKDCVNNNEIQVTFTNSSSSSPLDATLYVDKNDQVLAIRWTAAEQMWFLATPEQKFVNPNGYCQLIKHPNDIHTISTSHCGWCSSMGPNGTALYFDPSTRSTGSSDGTCMVANEGFIVPN